MLNFKIDAEFALALLAIFSVILIVTTILFVSRELGIQTYIIKQVGTPCAKVFCQNERYPAKEIARDQELETAYCQCADGSIRQARMFE